MTRRGIPMSNAGAYSNPDVAEMALTLILACGLRCPAHIPIAHTRNWADRINLHPIYRFTGRTVGLLGFGKLARELSWRLVGVGFKVQATDPHVSVEEMKGYEVESPVEPNQSPGKTEGLV